MDAETKTTWTPRAWMESRPRPNIPVVAGLRFDQYEEQCAATRELLGVAVGRSDDYDRAVVSDPYGKRYAVITSAFGECNRMWLCYSESVEVTAHPSSYSFDLHRMAAHLLTWWAFRDAHEAGTTEQYWEVGTL